MGTSPVRDERRPSLSRLILPSLRDSPRICPEPRAEARGYFRSVPAGQRKEAYPPAFRKNLSYNRGSTWLSYNDCVSAGVK